MDVSDSWQFEAIMRAFRTGSLHVSFSEIERTPRTQPQAVWGYTPLEVRYTPFSPQTSPVEYITKDLRAARASTIVQQAGAVSPAPAPTPAASESLAFDNQKRPMQSGIERSNVPSVSQDDRRGVTPTDYSSAASASTSTRPTPQARPSQPGLLSEVLKGKGGPGDHDHDSARGSIGPESIRPFRMTREPSTAGSRGSDGGSVVTGDIIAVIVYLPSKTPIRLRVPDSATVADTIAEVLRQARVKNLQPPLASDARCYELRLHDEDGEPDDDFPALDKTRKIRNFAHSGTHEYCLRVNPSAMAALKQAEALAKRASVSADPLESSIPAQPYASSSADGSRSLHPTLRVVIPGHPTPTVCMVPITEASRVQDVIEYVAKRHRLAVFHDRYVVRVSPVDQLRLNLPSRELAPHMLVTSLTLDSVELTKKTFADTPPEKSLATPGSANRRLARDSEASVRGFKPTDIAGTREGDSTLADSVAASSTLYGTARDVTLGITGSLSTSTLARPTTTPSIGPAGLMHNAITAAQFQEWHVIKINKRGKRQERLMGIDLTRITNRKVEKKRFISDKTMNAERLISDIRRLEVPDHDTRAFTIVFREGSEDVTLSYETQAPREREEIISKLSYILKMNGEGKRIIRTA